MLEEILRTDKEVIGFLRVALVGITMSFNPRFEFKFRWGRRHDSGIWLDLGKELWA